MKLFHFMTAPSFLLLSLKIREENSTAILTPFSFLPCFDKEEIIPSIAYKLFDFQRTILLYILYTLALKYHT